MDSKTDLTIKIFSFAVFLVLLNALFPIRPPRYNLKIGEKAKEDIIAPYDFFIMKSANELERERKAAKWEVPPVFSRIKSVGEKVDSIFDRILLAQTETEIRKIIPELSKKEAITVLYNKHSVKKAEEKIKEILGKGIIQSKDALIFNKIQLTSGKILNKKEIFDVKTAKEDYEKYLKKITGNQNLISALTKIYDKVVRSNLILNYKATRLEMKKAEEKVSPYKGKVSKGEVIVRAHQRIDTTIFEKLKALANYSKTLKAKLLSVIGQNLLYITISIAMFIMLKFLSPQTLKNRKKWLIAFSSLSLFFLLHALQFYRLSVYLIPIAFLSITLSLLLNEITAIIMVITASAFIAALPQTGFEELMISLLSGITIVFICSRVRKTSEFYKVVLYSILSYMVVAFSCEFIKTSDFKILLREIKFAALGGLGFSVLGFGLIPFFERSFRTYTRLSLIEFADLNRKIMKEFAEKAPGSYNHSILVASLAEAAAKEIGANSLLALIGGYYHDIGKLVKPEYFIENQMEGMKPAKEVKPEMMRSILLAHVREGVKIAEKEGLPEEVINIIKEHHGTTLMESLYYEGAPEEEFRYKGPVPSSKESAIVMLADAVEARVRLLEKVNPAKIMEIIEDTIDKRLKEGQLSNSNLTLSDLEKIKKAFLPILMGISHRRIEYPNANRNSRPDKKQDK